jgi:hypothetical protein
MFATPARSLTNWSIGKTSEFYHWQPACQAILAKGGEAPPNCLPQEAQITKQPGLGMQLLSDYIGHTNQASPRP